VPPSPDAPKRDLGPSPRAILFDLDDTLCDYFAARQARLRIALQMGRDGGTQPRPGVDIERMIEESVRIHPHGADHFVELLASFGIDDPEGARAGAEWYRRNRFHRLSLFPETVSVLEALGHLTLPGGETVRRPLGIVTNGPTEVQRAKLELLGVEDFVDFAIISEEFGAAKPDPEIFREAVRRCAAEPEDVIFVGDSPEFDIAGARGAGIRQVWVNRRGMPWDHATPAPIHEIASLDELLPLLWVA
jgi:putative hydrolase of the HAD superfamily